MESASSGKSRKPRRKFTPEFKAEAIRLCSEPGQSIGKVARNLDLTETALRAWVKQAKVDAGNGPVGALTTAEKQELAALRKEVRELKMEREILKKATAFFAKYHS
jgi:transposase-like protein